MRFISIVIVILFLLPSQQVRSCEILSLIVPERLCLGKSGNFRGNGIKAPGCGLETSQSLEVISGPGNHTLEYTTADNNEAMITFDQVGVYTIRYTFRDEDGCGTDPCTMEATTEVFFPSASFAEDSINICEGERIEAMINFENASNVSIQGQGLINVTNSGDGTGLYKTDVPVSQSFTLRIVRAQEGTCSNEDLLDSVFVNVLRKPFIMPLDTICDDNNENYTGLYKIIGGDGTYDLLTPEIGTIDGDTLTTIEIPSLEVFSYKINSGPTCGEFEGMASAECKCTASAGVMQLEPVVACEGERVEVLHDKNFVDKRPTDSIIYVLHNQDQAEISQIFDFSYDPVFDSPTEELLDSQLYISAVVGPFREESFDIDALNSIDCKGISLGTPVRWFKNDRFDITGILEVCAGEKNRMYKIDSDDDISSREDLFWYTTDGSGFVIESQTDERAYVSFPTATSSGHLYFQVDRKINNLKTCSSLDSVEITIDGTQSAPEEAKVILWPGNIFASTSDGPCYQWGFVDRFANFSVQLVGTNDKYFFSDEPIRGQLSERAYFCAVYDTPDCEFSFNNCNSITFYNQNTLNGLVEGVKDDFEVMVSPNPSDGRIRFELIGSFKGNYHIELYSEIGRRIKVLDVEKRFLRSIADLDFSDVSRGIYFLRVYNEAGESQVVKTVITR